MKRFIATLALASAIALPAVAQTYDQPARPAARPAPAADAHWRDAHARDAFAPGAGDADARGVLKGIVEVVGTTMRAFAAAAVDQRKSKEERDRAEGGGTTVSPNAPASTRGARSSNPQWDVYRPNGDYAGSDPDPRVRLKLHF